MHMVLNGFCTFADHVLNDMMSFIGVYYYALFHRKVEVCLKSWANWASVINIWLVNLQCYCLRSWSLAFICHSAPRHRRVVAHEPSNAGADAKYRNFCRSRGKRCLPRTHPSFYGICRPSTWGRVWSNVSLLYAISWLHLDSPDLHSVNQRKWLTSLHKLSASAADWLNYARYLPLYCTLLSKLITDQPEAYALLKAKGLAVRKSMVLACRNAEDITIEQTINWSSKSSGGIIGFSRNTNAYYRWCLTKHVREFSGWHKTACWISKRHDGTRRV